MIMLHGIGEDGFSGDFDNEEQLRFGGREHLNAVNSGKYDGFIMVPQSKGSTSSSTVFFPTEREAIVKFVEYGIKNLRVDQWKVQLQGYSAGGGAGWLLAIENPKIFTAGILMSAAGNDPKNNLDKLFYTALWHAQGGLDGAPTPGNGKGVRDIYVPAGANYRFQWYPKIGHGTWKEMYKEPDFFSFMMHNSMLRPHAVGFKQNFCPGEEVKGKMGVKQGFLGYRWQRFENTTGQFVTIQDGSNHELNFTQEGRYRVSIRRDASSDWSEWGPELEIKKVGPTPKVVIQASNSTTLPTLDEKHFVTLKAPKTDANGRPYQNFHWYKDGVLLGNDPEDYLSDSLQTSKSGIYTVVVTEELGCPSEPSDPIYVTSKKISQSLLAPTNFIAEGVSESKIELTWTDNSAGETGYELYGNRTNEEPWELIKVLPADANSFTHENLNFYTRYFYRLRAVNNEGSTAYLEKDYTKASGKTKKIDVSGSAPTGLKVSSSSRGHIALQWNPPTGLNDEDGVITYEIFDAVNQQVVATSSKTEFTLNDLAEKQWYTFSVRAVDLYNNKSPFSNQVTAGTFNQGLNYSYYEADMKSVSGISALAPVHKGRATTFDIDSYSQRRANQFAYKFEGYIIAPETGVYTFYSKSDDGSTVTINGDEIVDNDGIHGSKEEISGTVSLTAGAHKIEVLYFERLNNGETLIISWSGPGVAKEVIPASVLKDEFTQPSTPTAPSAFSATAKDQQSILLKWTDNSSNETGFEINRSTSNEGPFEFVATVEASKTEYLNSKLQPDTRYFYQLRALGNGGGSAFVGKGEDGIWVNAKTAVGSGGSEINAPTELKAVRQSEANVLLEWKYSSGNIDGFEIYRNGVLQHKTTTSQLSYTDNDASGTTTFGYKVRAFKGSSVSAYSNTATILGSNHAPVLTKIGDIQARYDNITQIKLIASDKDKDALTYSATNLPPFATIIQNEDGTADLKIQPQRTDAGTYENIILNVTDTKGGACSEVISLVVGENAAPGFFNPVILTLFEKTSRTVELSAWDANGEQLDFIMEGAPSFIVLSSNGNNSASLTLTPNYGHAGEYKFAVKATDPLGAVNFINVDITVAAVVTSQKVMINFNDSFHEQAQAPWNNVAMYPSTGTKFNNATNSEGVSTTTDLRFIDGFGRAEGGKVTGSNANEDFPDAVLKSHYYGFTEQERQIKISGLNPDLSYSFTIIGSKATTENVTLNTIYTINGISKTLDVRNNTTNTAHFTNISTATGEIILLVRSENPKQFSYINGLIIESEYIDNSQSLTPTQLNALLTEGGLINLSWVDNAFNESGYELQKSTDGTNFSQLALLEANSTGFTDVEVSTGATYHYRVRATATNTNLSSGWSNVTSIVVEEDSETDPTDPDPTDPTDPTDPDPTDPTDPNNLAPVLDENFAKVLHVVLGTEETYSFDLTDPNEEDQLTIITRYLPEFAQVTYDKAEKKVVIKLKPTPADVGYRSGVQLTTTDGALEDDVTFGISVTESEKISTYVNFMYDYPLRAEIPWNNTNVFPEKNALIKDLKSESRIVQPYVLKFLNNWTEGVSATPAPTGGPQPWGETTLDNSGIFPDAATKTAYVIRRNHTGQLEISGLASDKTYNFVFFGSNVYKSLAGSTKYTIGSETVTLSVQSNIENTVQINGIKATNGSIMLNVVSSDMHGSFLNAMVIEEYPNSTELESPGNLRVYGTTKSQIELKWNDRSKSEDGFAIYRRTLPSGSFIKINSTGPNATSYTDINLSTNTGYEYYVVAVKGNVDSEASEFKQAATLQSEVLVNFNNDNEFKGPNPWNNYNTIPREGNNKTKLIDDTKKNTGIAINIVENFDGANNAGPSASGKGIYPDGVIKSFYFTEAGSTAKLRIYGLQPELTYNFRLFAASAYVSDNGVTVYKIGDKKVSLDVQNNLSNTAVIRDIVAPKGEVLIEMISGEYARYGYINALEIEIRDGVKEKDGANTASKYSNDESSTASIQEELNEVTTVYPNPTRDELFVNFLAERNGKITLQVMDLQGRTVYLQDVQAQEGDNVFRMNLGSENISKGMYILRINSMDFTSKVVRFMKQ